MSFLLGFAGGGGVVGWVGLSVPPPGNLSAVLPLTVFLVVVMI